MGAAAREFDAQSVVVHQAREAPMSERSKGPISRRRRFMKLAGMTASVATNYARGQVKGVFQDAETRARRRDEA